MTDTEERLRRLEGGFDDLRADLGVLRKLMEQDHGSALNKIRYVTEKVLHQLCTKNDVSWGKMEPTLENMIGPLMAGKIIPRNVAIHVRTVQTNASPGSHYQESPLGATHVTVAHMALLEFLEWHHRTTSPEAAARDDAAISARTVEDARTRAENMAREVAAVSTATPKTARSARSVALVIGVLASIAAIAVWRPWDRRETDAARESTPATSATAAASVALDAPPPKEPTIGLRALEMTRNPKGAEVSLLASESFWQSAMRDFETAATAPTAPVRWRSGLPFAKAVVHMTRGEYADALVQLHAATAIEPTWALPHATMSGALARTDKSEEALEEARTAERLDPTWTGAVAAAARVQSRAGRLDAAIQEYRRALTAAPKDAVLLGELALTYHAKRLDSEAERYGRQALEIDPDLVAVRIMLAERALELRNGDEALTQASRAVGIEPTNTSALLCQADALAILGKKPEALAAYKSVLAAWRSVGNQGAPEARLRLLEGSVPKEQLPPQRVGVQTTATSILPERSRPKPQDPGY